MSLNIARIAVHLAVMLLVIIVVVIGITSHSVTANTPTETPVITATSSSTPTASPEATHTPGPLSTGDANAFLALDDGETNITITGDLVSNDLATAPRYYLYDSVHSSVRGDQLVFTTLIPVEQTDWFRSDGIRISISYPAGLPQGFYTLTDDTPFEITLANTGFRPVVIHDQEVTGTIALYNTGWAIQALVNINISGRWQVTGEAVNEVNVELTIAGTIDQVERLAQSAVPFTVGSESTPGPLSTGAMTRFITMADGEAEVYILGDLFSAGRIAVPMRNVRYSQEEHDDSRWYVFSGELLVDPTDLLQTNSVIVTIRYPADLPFGSYRLTDSGPIEVDVVDNALNPLAVYDRDLSGDISIYSSGSSFLALFDFTLTGVWSGAADSEIVSTITVNGAANRVRVETP